MKPVRPDAVAPAPMEGAGVYNQNSRVQAGGLRPAIPLLEWAARSAALAPGSEPIVIADYGSSAGHNSLLPMSIAVAALRERAGKVQPISVVHTDVPGNDFPGLFQTLQADPESYRRGGTAIYSSAVGQSFYEQILPTESVTLGWSSWAVQWLSRMPGPIADQVQIGLSNDAAARAAFQHQAAEDWRNFLTHRERELRPGGRLVVITMALTDDGDFGYRSVHEAIYEVLDEMVSERFIAQAEVEGMVIPTYSRKRADFLAPFNASGRFGALKAETVEIFMGEDAIWAEYQASRNAAAFGARWAAFARAAVFQTLALGLDGGREDARAVEFVATLEKRVAEKVAKAPQPATLPLARLAFSKLEV